MKRTDLPDVLFDLKKVPKVFASFSTEQFLSVFAITLPYTNPFKFNHYTVSLAHQPPRYHHVVPQVQTDPEKRFCKVQVELMFRSGLRRGRMRSRRCSPSTWS